MKNNDAERFSEYDCVITSKFIKKKERKRLNEYFWSS